MIGCVSYFFLLSNNCCIIKNKSMYKTINNIEMSPVYFLISRECIDHYSIEQSFAITNYSQIIFYPAETNRFNNIHFSGPLGIQVIEVNQVCILHCNFHQVLSMIAMFVSSCNCNFLQCLIQC